MTIDGLDRLSIDDVDMANEAVDAWDDACVRARDKARKKGAV